MSADILAQLGQRARETHSNGFTILHRGEVLSDHTFERTDSPVSIMSVTKMVVGVAYGRLLDDGILASLDTPISDILPERRQGLTRNVTVCMILNHTTGLQNDPNAGIEIEPAPDWTQLALCAELDADPGTVFAYNNKAVFLLHPIIQRLTGNPLDVFLREMLFQPLGIPDDHRTDNRDGRCASNGDGGATASAPRTRLAGCTSARRSSPGSASSFWIAECGGADGSSARSGSIP